MREGLLPHGRDAFGSVRVCAHKARPALPDTPKFVTERRISDRLKVEEDMNVTVQIPDDIAARLCAAGGNLSRRALEGLALEEYKNEHITKAELRRLLGFSTRYELDGFLKAHEVWIDYTVEDAHRDAATLERLGF